MLYIIIYYNINNKLNTTLKAPSGSFTGFLSSSQLCQSHISLCVFLAQGAEDLRHPQSVGTAATTSLASRSWINVAKSAKFSATIG